MRRLLLAALAVSILSVSAVVQAQGTARGPTPVPIEEWSLAKVSAMGREIYIQDSAAWLATDALMASIRQDELAQVRGWIVEPQGADRKVRFLKASGEGVRIGCVVVVVGSAAGAVSPVDAELSTEEQSRWAARQTAMSNIGALRCSRNLNTVVAEDPDSDGWLVWLLTATDEAGVVPIGGHYRFHISADGQTVVRRDQLSNGCINMRTPDDADPDGPQLMFVTQLVSSGPVETHVFLSMQSGLPIFVATGDRVFAVEGEHIEDVTDQIGAAD